MLAALTNISRRIATLESGEGTATQTISGSAADFARRVGLEDLDRWQEELLLSNAPRILLNITSQGGRFTMSDVLAMHKALADPGSLVPVLAPSEC